MKRTKKSFVIGGIVGLGVLGAVSTTVFIAGQNNQPKQKKIQTTEKMGDKIKKSEEQKGSVEQAEEMLQEETLTEKTSAEKTSIEKEVILSQEQKKGIEVLVKTLTATRWGEELDGEEIKPDEQSAGEVMGRICNESFEGNEWAYDEYLPEKTDSETAGHVFTETDIQHYIKEVFGIESGKPNEEWFYEQNGNYAAVSLEAGEYDSADKSSVDKMMEKDGIYTITGTTVFGEYPDLCSTDVVYKDRYEFTMSAEKNEDSPFGFTVRNISYKKPEPLTLGDEQWKAILQMVSAAEKACISHWQMSEDFEIHPSEMSVTSRMNYASQGYRFGWGGDTQEQKTVEELSQLLNQVTGTQLSKEELDASFEEMQNGNFIYKGTEYQDGMVNLYTSVEAFYGSGMVDRYEIEKNECVYVNKALYYAAYEEAVNHAVKAEKISEGYLAVSGVSDLQSVPFTVYLQESEESPTGYILDYIHYYISQSPLAGDTGAVLQRNPQIPSGTYESTRGFELDFYGDYTVRVSEGGENTVCDFTIDAEGNIVIDPEGEAVPAVYFAQEDEVEIYGKRFKK